MGFRAIAAICRAVVVTNMVAFLYVGGVMLFNGFIIQQGAMLPLLQTGSNGSQQARPGDAHNALKCRYGLLPPSHTYIHLVILGGLLLCQHLSHGHPASCQPPARIVRLMWV
jgi:hypothetical protein